MGGIKINQWLKPVIVGAVAAVGMAAVSMPTNASTVNYPQAIDPVC
jgi:hypothetical protein